MNKNTQKLAVLIFLLALGYPFIVYAVSYSPIPARREEKAAKGLRKKGETVCLFQSGTGDVKKIIVTGDVIAVFREYPEHVFTQVGKIKVILYLSDYYIKGEVAEGEVRAGDVAKKRDAAGLVITDGERCR